MERGDSRPLLTPSVRDSDYVNLPGSGEFLGPSLERMFINGAAINLEAEDTTENICQRARRDSNPTLRLEV